MKTIIVQAGGVGSRMNRLSSVKPKCLIPIDGKPILFHLFDTHKDDKFIIITDYFGDILKTYVKKFRPNVNIVWIDAKIKGTAAGIKDAVEYTDGSFFVIWSDLLVTKELNYSPIGDISVGLTNMECNFPCRWSYQDGKLSRNPNSLNGVAGLFWFKHKDILKDLDESKSLTSFISEKQFSTFNINDIDDIGTEERFYNKHKNNRFFNRLTFSDTEVHKEAIVEEYKKLIKDEINWYKHVTNLGYTKIPKLISESPFIIQRLKGKNPFELIPDINFIFNAIDGIKKLHELETIPTNTKELELVYIEKTLNRVFEVAELIPFFNEKTIKINDAIYSNPFAVENIKLFKQEIKNLYNIKNFNLIHGDCTFSNMINVDGQAILIDPRGYFGKEKLYGDPRYDWAKLYYSFVGNYDNVNSKKYDIQVNNTGVYYTIDTNGWEVYEKDFFKNIPYSEKEIKLIHVLIWFSLCGYVIEDYSSILLAFYNGVVLWNKIQEANNNEKNRI